MATAAATDPTVGTIGATPVLFFPVPTPWPMSARCDKHIHRQVSKGSILAWDPVYPRILSGIAGVEGGESCYPTQQQSWHFQASTATPSTALGPTFVCPESYTAVFSTLIESNSASRTDYTYCCPPKYTLNALLPPNQRSAAQCTSILPIGSTLSFISVTFTPTVISSTTTNVLAYIPSSTVVTAAPETVFGSPVNGYNIVAAAAQRPLDSSSSTSTPTGGGGAAPTGASGPGLPSNTSTGTPAGTIAGAVVGGLVALALGVALAYFVGRRRSRMAGAGAGAGAVEVAGSGVPPGQAYAVGPHGHQGWGDKESPYQLGVAPATTAVPDYGNGRHELPSQNQRFELPAGAGASQEGAQGGQGGGYYRPSGPGGV
ncbi:hypothetical protein B0T18DRAFT_490626 [Schizothecium vesticola]|uniref:Uncharacterized protein n=1 Tax=Schizothecium vesticola TaxID=314040 RepID=A0AA40ERC0_9PEZI|nr:hypothetical protein B0T18DRAFT_490626 [Schizothecium vesticola]